MNYITSCPACETQFLLTDAHLKAHRGKVQCGNCEHIFNAKNRLTEVSDDIHSPADYQASIETQDNETSQISEDKPMSEVLNVVLESVPNLEDLNTTESSDSALDIYDKPSNSNQRLPETIDSFAFNQTLSPITINDLTADPKYQETKTKPNVWLVLTSILLAILAVIQYIYAARTQISAEYPQFKPYLVHACSLLNCKIDLPKNLDFFTIDDSDMQEDSTYQNVIRFSSLLINDANYAQAYPDIELTLTSTDDQPVLRRLIKPNEYLQTSMNVASGLTSREEVRINLAINVKDLTVAGYRVLLVY